MSFVAELKRRNVVRVGIAYALIAWVILQAADFGLQVIDAPNWILQVFVLAAAIGLPVVLIFSWIFEMTPEGIKRETEIDRSASVAPETGRKLDRAIIVFLVLVIAVMGLERFAPDSAEAPSEPVAVAAEKAPDTLSDETAPAKSIAVLPFLNMSSDADNEYFSDGVSEEILNVLAAIPELKVASRTSAFRYKNSDLAIEDIADELGVNHVLEGSVRKSGNQVRITAQLIHADDGFHLWSETYDRQLDNIFAIQDEIAGNIAQVLQVQLLGAGKNYTTVQNLSPENYEKFLKARFLLRQRNENAINEAMALTRSVLEENPDFPVGMTQLAEALVQQNSMGEADRLLEVQQLANRSLTLEPNLAAAHMIKGELAQRNLQPLQAITQLERAIELNPSEPRPHHWMGIILANAGYLDRARRELEMAVELEPDHANANGYLGFVLLLQDDYEGAQRHFDLQEQLGNPFGAQRGVQIAVLKGEPGLARQLIRERDGFSAQDAERLRLFVSASEDPVAVDAYLAFIDEQPAQNWHMVLELLELGQFERALAIDLGGYPRYSWSERWAEARALPAFQKKIDDANLPEVWDALGPPPACRKVPSGYDCANRESQ